MPQAQRDVIVDALFRSAATAFESGAGWAVAASALARGGQTFRVVATTGAR